MPLLLTRFYRMGKVNDLFYGRLVEGMSCKRILCAFIFTLAILGFSAGAGARRLNVSIPTWGMPVIAFTIAQDR